MFTQSYFYTAILENILYNLYVTHNEYDNCIGEFNFTEKKCVQKSSFTNQNGNQQSLWI